MMQPLAIGLCFVILTQPGNESAAPPANKPAPSVQITWNFDNGALGAWETNAAGEIQLTHSPGSGGLWYYFQIDGAANQTRTFVFENARKDSYGHSLLPSISYDQEHWAYIKDRLIEPHPTDLDRVRFRFTHTFAADRAWIAYTPPYPNPRLDALVKRTASYPQCRVEILGEAPLSNLPIPIFILTDPETPDVNKKYALILSREEGHETASSWLAEGMVRFLLSSDPVAAALLRAGVFLIAPLFDRDAVAAGYAVHPLAKNGPGVYWTETWPESTYSFFEQRQLKRFLQGWKDGEKRVDFSFRIHSQSWNEDQARREHAAEANIPLQDRIFTEGLGRTYMPWYRVPERLLQDTRFSKYVLDLFPGAVTGLLQSDYLYSNDFGLNFHLYKTPDDLLTEGELMLRALGESLGIPSLDPPPYLHAAELYELTESQKNQPSHARCVYRDLLGRPPEFVRLYINDTPYELKPVTEGKEPDFRAGIPYTGYYRVEQEVNRHHFEAANGSRTVRIPAEGDFLGPFRITSTRTRRR
ncbi:MAG: M14-type cytosolic carboxypeptidase [bacterium]